MRSHINIPGAKNIFLYKSGKDKCLWNIGISEPVVPRSYFQFPFIQKSAVVANVANSIGCHFTCLKHVVIF